MTLPPEADSDMAHAPPPAEHEMSLQAGHTIPLPDLAAPPEFEELTLAQLLARFWRAPRRTWLALQAVASTPRTAPPPRIPAPSVEHVMSAQAAAAVVEATPEKPARITDRRAAAQLGLRLAALLLAWWGNGILANAPIRTESLALDAGAPYLILAFALWLISEVYGDWPALRERWQHRREQETGAGAAEAPVSQDTRSARRVAWTGIHPARVFLALGGLFCSLIALRFTAGNQFTFIGFWSWVASIVLWVGALAPAAWSPGRLIDQSRSGLRGLQWRGNWTLWALVGIVLLGASLRLADVPRTPPEMTSDHVEKILDAQRVLDGNHQVFFPNNGGREGFQMYAMALFAQLPGLGMNFTTLKLLSAVEGLIAIVLMFALGRAALAGEDRRLAILVGLMLAGLVAASYWHTALSRLGLRIIMTTIVTALLLIFLARALRHNRRADFILAGLALGLGLYTYQAVRMLPVVIIVGLALAFVLRVRSLREAGRCMIHFAVLVVVAFVVFVPLFGYSLQYPEDFWRRTSGRLLGDDVVEELQEDGTIIRRNASLEERLEAFNQNLPILTNNIRNALLMFNWKGDVAWINAAPNRPALDTFTGALFIVGLAAWLARMIRRRDVFDWLVPLALVIMLLPSALSIAYPVENPSHTRTSGALPTVYLIAALPLALMIHAILQLGHRRWGGVLAGALVGFVLLGAHSLNSRIYFNDYHDSYIISSLPYSEAGRILRGFAESDGSYGNAFMIAYPYWWDHRAVGIEAGRTDWPNGIVTRESVPGFLAEASRRADRYRFDPEQDILFFYASGDEQTEAYLQRLFPHGYSTLRQSYQADDDYKLFRVPRLGSEAFYDFMVENLAG